MPKIEKDTPNAKKTPQNVKIVKNAQNCQQKEIAKKAPKLKNAQNCKNRIKLQKKHPKLATTPKIAENIKICKSLTLTWVISSAKNNATCIGSKFGQHVKPFALVPILARWGYLH